MFVIHCLVAIWFVGSTNFFRLFSISVRFSSSIACTHISFFLFIIQSLPVLAEPGDCHLLIIQGVSKIHDTVLGVCFESAGVG